MKSSLVNECKEGKSLRKKIAFYKWKDYTEIRCTFKLAYYIIMI